MKDLIEKLEAIDTKSGNLNVIIETPKGSQIKYSYDPETGFLLLCKSLPEGMMFPFNFGFVPKTLADDGDPLDVLILNDQPLIPGCLLRVRPVAVVKATQTEQGKLLRNDRIIGQALSNEAPITLSELELKKGAVPGIEFFFKAYNQIYGKEFKVLGTGGVEEANSIIKQAIEKFEKKTAAG